MEFRSTVPPSKALRFGPVRHLGHRPALDGLRGIAWIAVFLSHANILPNFALSDTGMFLFFALSGFLITQLIVSEYSTQGSVKLREFLKKRAIRLVPALVAFLLVWFCVVAIFMGSLWLTTVPEGGAGQLLGFKTALEGILASVSYFINWAIIFHLFKGYVPIGHLWSLAVEMQFYVLWSLILVFLVRLGRKTAFWTATVLSILASVEAIVLMYIGSSGLRVYMGTDIRAGALLGGASAALVWSDKRIRLDKSKSLSLISFLAVGIIFWSTVAFRKPTLSLSQLLAWPLTAIAAAIVVLYLVERSNSVLGRWMSNSILRYLGSRSYALYLWHYVWLTWFRDLGVPGIIAALGMSLLSAELSWRLVELPIASWRRAVLRKRADLGTVTASDRELQLSR